MISIIVAMDENRGIGLNGNLLTYLPGDLPRFKTITNNHTVIMGRKTFDSLPKGPLPNRTNIVITRNRELNIPGATVVHSLSEAVDKCNSEEECFIIGGGELYKESINIADKLYITHIKKSFKADTFFPEIIKEWKLIDVKEINDNPELQFSYNIYSK